MTRMFREIDYKGFAVFLAVCGAFGGGISYFSELSFVTAVLIVALALLVNGLAIYTEDLEPGGFDHQPGVTDTPEAKKEQKKAQRIHGTVILVFFIALLWSII